MQKISGLKFPDFYCECAYRDGYRAQRDADHSAILSYYSHGEPVALGVDWYRRGAQAQMLGLVAYDLHV